MFLMDFMPDCQVKSSKHKVCRQIQSGRGPGIIIIVGGGIQSLRKGQYLEVSFYLTCNSYLKRTTLCVYYFSAYIKIL